MVGLAADHGEQTTVMIPEGNRTATCLGVKRGARTPDRANQRRYEHETALHLRLPRTPSELVSDRWTSRDYIGLRALVSSLPNVKWLLRDRGYDTDWFRDALQDKGIRACIPGRIQSKKTVLYPSRDIPLECTGGQ